MPKMIMLSQKRVYLIRILDCWMTREVGQREIALIDGTLTSIVSLTFPVCTFTGFVQIISLNYVNHRRNTEET